MWTHEFYGPGASWSPKFQFIRGKLLIFEINKCCQFSFNLPDNIIIFDDKELSSLFAYIYYIVPEMRGVELILPGHRSMLLTHSDFSNICPLPQVWRWGGLYIDSVNLKQRHFKIVPHHHHPHTSESHTLHCSVWSVRGPF